MLRPRLAWTIIVTAALAFSAVGLGAQVALAAVPGLSPTPPATLQGQGGSTPTTPANPALASNKPAARRADLPHTGLDLQLEALVAIFLLGIGAALRGFATPERRAA